jgi:SOS-response transcriptional repressor LexA
MEQNKPSVTAIIDRMKTVLGIQLDKELAEVLGGSRGFVSVIKNRGTIPYDECVTIAVDRNISLDWLILGRGVKEAGVVMPVAAIAPHLVEVPFHDAAAFGELLEGQGWYVGRAWMDQQGLAPGETIAVRVAGDSMGATLPEDQVALVDRRQRSGDGVYLVRFGDAAPVHFRRIQHMADGSVRLSCDNPAYAAEVVPAAQLGRLHLIGYCHSVVRAVR